MINATGVVLHTNLGRAPLSSIAIRAAVEAAEGYNDLEYDLVKAGGARGPHRRARGFDPGADPPSSSTITRGGAALPGRRPGGKLRYQGELVEIGGYSRCGHNAGDRRRAGSRDYEQDKGLGLRKAASESAVAILKVHPPISRSRASSEVGVREPSEIARKHRIPFIFDGLRCLANVQAFGLPPEPSPKAAIEQGADVVTFSGDKLLGGPQCGIIAGKADLVSKISRSPLARAFRVDKMRIAALAATLAQYESEDSACDIPTVAMLREPFEEIMSRAVMLCSMIKERTGSTSAAGRISFRPVETLDEVGGGSLPGAELKGAGVHVSSSDVKASEASGALREARPAVVALERAGGMLFSLRTVRRACCPCSYSARS